MLLLLPLPLPLLMLLFADFCCYQQHTLNVLFSPHLTFQSDWDVLVVVVADGGVAVVLAPLCCVFYFCLPTAAAPTEGTQYLNVFIFAVVVLVVHLIT